MCVSKVREGVPVCNTTGTAKHGRVKSKYEENPLVPWQVQSQCEWIRHPGIHNKRLKHLLRIRMIKYLNKQSNVHDTSDNRVAEKLK